MPGYPIITPLAPSVWIVSERTGIGLPGRLAPYIFGLMIGRWPHRVKAEPQASIDSAQDKE